jgi:hypothetical protein
MAGAARHSITESALTQRFTRIRVPSSWEPIGTAPYMPAIRGLHREVPGAPDQAEKTSSLCQ